MFRKICDVLSGPSLFTAVLPVLMIYLLLGTVAQKYIGLYGATQIFFASTLLWVGPVPLPGLPVFLVLIFLNLAFNLIFKSPWKLSNAGIIITHIGAMLLLFGGLLTAATGNEGYVDLLPNQKKSSVSDYHNREVVVLDNNQNVIDALPFNSLTLNQHLVFPVSKISITIKELCRNCQIKARENPSPNLQGMAKNMMLSPSPLKPQDEENFGGITFSISNSTADENIYLILEDVPKLATFSYQDKNFSLALRKSQRSLPFSITLLDFRKETHPGTDLASAYTSRVLIEDAGSKWESLISMNQPLRYKGYTLFQSSFAMTPLGEMSVLAVVYNYGRVFPYISSLAMCLGIIIHISLRLRTRRISLMRKLKTLSVFFLTFILCLNSNIASAKQSMSFDMTSFSMLPVLHEGRIKPIESLAINYLRKINGNDHLENMNASQWLAEALFDPSRAETRPVLKIRNPEIINMLGLTDNEQRTYSLRDIAEKLSTKQEIIISIASIPEESWTGAQKDLVALQRNAVAFGNLLGSLTLFLPLSSSIPQDAPSELQAFAGKTLTYMETLKFRERLENSLKKIISVKGEDIENYTATEQSLAYLSFSLAQIKDRGIKSKEFKIIPDHLSQSENRLWLSPWEVIEQGAGTPETTLLFGLWQNLASSYHNGDNTQWENNIALIAADMRKTVGLQVRPEILQLEHYYNQYNPFKIAFIFYLASAICLASYIFLHSVKLTKVSLGLLCAASLGHLCGLIMRVCILQRPPVSTLYESILFVGFVSVAYGLNSYRYDHKLIWLALCAFSGVFLSLLGFAHQADSDSFVMLSAVLNTNFWLATHVLCITTGYGFCLVVSFLSHYALFMMNSHKTAQPSPEIFGKIYIAALFALLFSATGTVLGGIWADQSWGRFWGWDPKENGALLIVLWLLWILHGRSSGVFSPLFCICGLAYLSAIVAISWFGVNLLSVGLHAYGFTSSAAWLFWAFLACESILIGFLMFSINSRIYLKEAI